MTIKKKMIVRKMVKMTVKICIREMTVLTKWPLTNMTKYDYLKFCFFKKRTVKKYDNEKSNKKE
jgi:hypothetical protein